MSTPRNQGSPLLVLKGVTKRFVHEGKTLDILRGIDLTIERADMVALVGASGAGKSTLLHIMGTLDNPTEGSVVYEGEDVTRFSERRLSAFRNKSLGFIFQFHHLLPEFSALENVMMPGLIQGEKTAKVKERAAALLNDVGLSHRATHRPSELSGGEQQRVALARALVLLPKLVLADEPTGNLDSVTGAAIQELFLAMNQKHGTTFFVVTHSRDFASRLPRILTMSDGSFAQDPTGAIDQTSQGVPSALAVEGTGQPLEP